MIRFDKVWHWDEGDAQYNDFTSNQKLDSSIAFCDNASDYWYFGLKRRPIGMMVELSTNGSYGTFTYQYWNGAWTQLAMLSSYDFDSTKYAKWVLPDDMSTRQISSTDPHTGTSLDLEADLYWIRVNAASVTSAATISKIRAIPYNAYATHQNISAMLQLKTDFDASKRPYPHDVEDLIRSKEDRVDYITRKSWKFNYEVNEEQEFNISGIRLNHFPLISMYSLQIYDGSSWETKTLSATDSRNSDYFTIDELGTVKFSRFFILPARFAYIPPAVGRWDFGEFSYPTRISYSWGRDLETDRQFGTVREICSKMVAMDIYNSYDYTVLTRSGIDKVAYDRKIANWKIEIEEKLEELISVVMH